MKSEARRWAYCRKPAKPPFEDALCLSERPMDKSMTRFLILATLGLAFLGLSAHAQPPAAATVAEDGQPLQGRTAHPVMHPDFDTREQWRRDHAALPQTVFDPQVQHRLTPSAPASGATSPDS